MQLIISGRRIRWCRSGRGAHGPHPGNVLVFAVGAVYDRATFASEWAKCAVIDRAYRESG